LKGVLMTFEGPGLWPSRDDPKVGTTELFGSGTLDSRSFHVASDRSVV
jgi:hypothetical protein